MKWFLFRLLRQQICELMFWSSLSLSSQGIYPVIRRLFWLKLSLPIVILIFSTACSVLPLFCPAPLVADRAHAFCVFGCVIGCWM